MKKLFVLLLVTSCMFAQSVPDLIVANKEQNMGIGGGINIFASAKDAFGNTYLTGSFSNIADFDPSAAEDNKTSIGSSDLFVAVYDSSGNYISTRNIGGSGTVSPAAIVISGGFMYLAGIYTETIDFDSSASVSNLTSTYASGAGFLAKYDLNGNFVTAKSIDGVGSIAIRDIKFYNNELVIGGQLTGSVDFDPSSSTLTLTATGANDGFVAKYNNSLLLQNAVSFGGGANSTANVTSIATDATGNILIAGSYLTTVDFDPSANSSSLTTTSASVSHTFMAKFTNAIAFTWVKDIGGRVSGTAAGTRFVIDASGNIIIAGTFNQTSDFDPSAISQTVTSNGQLDIFVGKYDANGEYVWIKKIGSTSNEISRGVALDASNNIHIFGTFTNIVDFDPNAGILNLSSINGTNFFAKYDNNGSLIYANNIAGTIAAMIVNNNSELELSGSFSGTRDFDPALTTANLYSAANNLFLAKYASNGGFVFAKPIGGDKPSNVTFNFIASDGVGNIFRVGLLSATTDLDPSSAVFNLSSPVSNGIFIAKYTSSGGFSWAKSISAEVGFSLTLNITNTDVNGNTYIMGRFLGTVDFDPSANVSTLTSNNGANLDVYIAKYDTNGNLVWVKQISGLFSPSAKRIVFDSAGNFYFAGRISTTSPIDFDPSAATAFYTPVTASFDIVFAKFTPNGNYVWVKGIAGAGASTTETHIALKGNSFYLSGLFLGSIKFNPATNDVTTSATNGLNGFIAKYDLDGNYQFASEISPSANGNSSVVFNVAVDDNNDFYLFTSLLGTADFDLTTTATAFVSSPVINAVATTAYVLSKHNATGGLIWAKSLVQNTPSASISQNAVHSYYYNNELIYVYPFNGGLDIDPSSTDFIVTTNPQKNNVVISKYNSSTGDLFWGNKIDGDYNAGLNGTNFGNNANLLISGAFIGTADFDFSSGVRNLSSAFTYNFDRFYAKYDSTTLSLAKNEQAKRVVIYPNPTHSILNIVVDKEIQAVKIIDIAGRATAIKSFANNAIEVGNLSKGVYFIEIKTNEGLYREKFIKN